MCCSLATTVLAFGMRIRGATGCRCVDPISDVVVAVGFAASAIACFQAISIGPVGITAVAVSVAATPFAASALAAMVLVAMALAFHTSLIVPTLWGALASILITSALATSVTIATATTASLHALAAVTALATIAPVAALTSVTSLTTIAAIASRIGMSMTPRMLASPIASSITTT